MIFDCFVDDKNAVTTTVDVGRRFFKQGQWRKGQKSRWHQSFHITVCRHFRHYRETILQSQQAQYPKFSGEVEVNLAYFGAHRRRRSAELLEFKKSHGIAVGKQVAKKIGKPKRFYERPVLGILQRGGPVLLLPVESRARPFLELLLRQVIVRGSVVYTDFEKGLGEISLLGYVHRAVNHSRHYVDENGWHINGIEAVFRMMKDRMGTRFKGIPKNTLDLHIKEREFRFSHRNDFAGAMRALLRSRIS